MKLWQQILFTFPTIKFQLRTVWQGEAVARVPAIPSSSHYHSQDLCIEDQQTLEMRRIVRKNISKKQNMKPESLLFDNTRNVGNPILISKLVPEMISDPSYRKWGFLLHY